MFNIFKKKNPINDVDILEITSPVKEKKKVVDPDTFMDDFWKEKVKNIESPTKIKEYQE